MGRDRTSIVKTKNGFTISTDKDHLGRFRGNQRIIKKNGKHFYRGWHYHIEHPSLTQIQIFDMLKAHLHWIGSLEQITDSKKICVGNASGFPSTIAHFIKIEYTIDSDEEIRKSLVLWIGQMGKLHLEPNKCEPFQRTILTKKDLINYLENDITIPGLLKYVK